MLTLSIRQPWAWLIVHGYKPVENRTWSTKVRGRFQIHAGKSFDDDGLLWILEHGLVPFGVLPEAAAWPMGGIVGEATLVDCRFPGQFAAAEKPWRDPDQYGFILADPTPRALVPCRGRLGFFQA